MMFDSEVRAKPVLKWAGGKSGVLEQLFRYFPRQFGRYVEPFIGGGAVFFSLRQQLPALLNDSNAELVSLYRVIRESPVELMAELDKLSLCYSEEFFYHLRNTRLADPVRAAARTIFLNKTGFNGLYRQNAKGEFNVPFGKRPRCPALYEPENLTEVSRRLRHANLTSHDFAAIIAEAREGDFVYCDPPYEPVSSTSSFTSYVGGGFSQDEQRRLRDACVDAAKRGVRVAVSNSASPLIASLYKGHEVRPVVARRAINSKGDGRGEVAEVLILLGF